MIIQTQAFWVSVLVPDRPLTLITFISPNRAQVSFKHSIAVSQEAAPCQQRRARETLPPAVNANIDIWRSTKEMEGEWAASRHTFLLAIIMWNVKSFLSSTTKSIFVNTKEYDWPDLCNGPRFKPSRTKNISQYENDLRSIFSLSDKAAHMIEVPQSRTDVIPGHGWHRTGPVEDGGRSTPTHSALRCDPSFPNRTMMRRPCALVKQKTRRLTSNNKHMLIWNNTDLQAHKLNNHIFCKRKKRPVGGAPARGSPHWELSKRPRARHRRPRPSSNGQPPDVQPRAPCDVTMEFRPLLTPTLVLQNQFGINVIFLGFPFFLSQTRRWAAFKGMMECAKRDTASAETGLPWRVYDIMSTSSSGKIAQVRHRSLCRHSLPQHEPDICFHKTQEYILPFRRIIPTL